MSKPSCDACSNLRENNANFIMNGVTDTVAASLANNTGFNPCLTSLHNDCEDLNDANDCLIGHLDDDVDNYDVCKWKDFMHNFLPNLYEMLKAIIAAICGLWTAMSDVIEKISKINTFVCNGIDTSIPMTIVHGTLLSDVDIGNGRYWGILAGIKKYDGCGSDSGVGAIKLMLEIQKGGSIVASRAYNYVEKLAEFNKSDLVPNLMTEKEYENIYKNGFQMTAMAQGGSNSKSLFNACLYGSTIDLSDASDTNPNDHSKLILYAWGYIGGIPTTYNCYGYRQNPIIYPLNGVHS